MKMKFICLNVLIISMFIAPLTITVQGQVVNNTVGNNLPALKRGKRYLEFTKGSRMSWRTTVKNNILKVNTLWGYGFGFRANFPFPDKADRRRPFFKRDVFQSLTDVLDGHGLDGQACILKSYCTAHLDSDSEISRGMLFKLLKYLFTVLLTQATTNLVGASLLAIEPTSSWNNNETDKEIAFISVNGNLINASNMATTQTAQSYMNLSGASSVSTAMGGDTKPDGVLRRGKRYLDFLNTSRMFFRVNAKNNIVPKPVIWAHAYGFRCNFPIENDKRVRPFRRDTYEALGELMTKSGFDGKACILKAFCAAHLHDEGNGMNGGILFKLLKHIFTLNDEDKRHFPYLHQKNCHQILHSHCPLSFNNISPFTDDV